MSRTDPPLHGYTRAWHLNEKTDTLDNRTEAYTYDSYYRLREVDYNNDGVPDENYTLDGVHNIELSTEDGVSFAWGVDKYNRLRNKIGGGVTNAYSYDARDNMTAETDGTDTTEYVYDDLNRLIGVKVNGIPLSAYLYDAFNRRIMKQSGTSDHWYAYDDWNIVAEYVTEGTTTYTNCIDTGMDGHLAMVPSGNIADIRYFSTDERGNVVALVNASGTVLERYRYTVYGEPTIMEADFSPSSATEAMSPFLWGGSYMDNETGLYWMRNRYYHIGMKRFINQDPIGIWGDANNLGNGFSYVAGMVIEHSDLTGLRDETYADAAGSTSMALGWQLFDACLNKALGPLSVPFSVTRDLALGVAEKKSAGEQGATVVMGVMALTYGLPASVSALAASIGVSLLDAATATVPTIDDVKMAKATGDEGNAEEWKKKRTQAYQDLSGLEETKQGGRKEEGRDIFARTQGEHDIKSYELVDNDGKVIGEVVVDNKTGEAFIIYVNGEKVKMENAQCEGSVCTTRTSSVTGKKGKQLTNRPADPEEGNTAYQYFQMNRIRRMILERPGKEERVVLKDPTPSDWISIPRVVYVYPRERKLKDPVLFLLFSKSRYYNRLTGELKLGPESENGGAYYPNTAWQWVSGDFNPGNIDPYEW